jgi:hypothetical protein
MDPPPMPSDMPTPSVPTFTLKYVDHSYDAPETTISPTDPYTGKVTTQTQSGHHVKNFTIDIIIDNQNFQETVHTNSRAYTLTMEYIVRWKGNFEQEWQANTGSIEAHSHTGTTTLSFPTDSITPGGTLDFQVKATLGYNADVELLPTQYFQSKSSAWSNTQSITLPEESTTQPTPTPTIETSPMYAPYILPLTAVTVLATLGAGFFMYNFKKHKST